MADSGTWNRPENNSINANRRPLTAGRACFATDSKTHVGCCSVYFVRIRPVTSSTQTSPR